MKILSINPGSVSASPNGWQYSIILKHPNGQSYQYSKEQYSKAGAAKQAMREEVARLRKIHLPD